MAGGALQQLRSKKDTAKHLFDLPYIEEDGYATNGKETIAIRTIRTQKATTQKGRPVNMPVKMPAGYELRIDDGVVGIIDTYDNNVWIYNEMDKKPNLSLRLYLQQFFFVNWNLQKMLTKQKD